MHHNLQTHRGRAVGLLWLEIPELPCQSRFNLLPVWEYSGSDSRRVSGFGYRTAGWFDSSIRYQYLGGTLEASGIGLTASHRVWGADDGGSSPLSLTSALFGGRTTRTPSVGSHVPRGRTALAARLRSVRFRTGPPFLCTDLTSHGRGFPSSVAPVTRGLMGLSSNGRTLGLHPRNVGSSPTRIHQPETHSWGCSSTGRATRLHREGCRFKSDLSPPIAHHDSGSLERGESTRITPVVPSKPSGDRNGNHGRVAQRQARVPYKNRVGGSSPSVATSIEGSFNGQDARLIRGQYRFDSCAFNQNHHTRRRSHVSATPSTTVFIVACVG